MTQTIITKNKGSNRWMWILGIATIALIGVAIYVSKGKKTGEKVHVEKVQKHTIQESVSASGRIYPEKEVKISSDVSGEVIEMLVKEGDSVRAGQLLCRVNAEIYKSQVARGEAGVSASQAQYAYAQSNIKSVQAREQQVKAQSEQIQAQLATAKTAFKRNDQLHNDGVISDADFETTQSQLRQQEAGLRSAEAQIQSALSDVSSSEKSADAARYNLNSSEASLKELKTSLNKTSIYAPVDGIVSKRNVQKGERVVGTAQMSGTEIMRVANMNALEVQVNVSENDIARIATGNEVDVEVDAFAKRKFKGRVSEIANTADNAFTATGLVNLTTDQVTNFVVKIRLDPASYADLLKQGRTPFHPGMSASVDIHTNRVNDAVCVPIQSVTTRDENAELKKAKATEAANSNTQQQKTMTTAPVKEVLFIAVGDSVRMVEVKTGIQDNDFIQIISGLKGDEEVVSAPYNLIARKLKSGMKVQKVTEKELYKTDDKSK